MSTPGVSSTWSFGVLNPRFWQINALSQAASQAPAMASVGSKNGGFDSPGNSNAPVIPPQGDVTPTSSDLEFPLEEFNSPEQFNSDSKQVLQEPDNLEALLDIRQLFDVEDDVEANKRQQTVLDMEEALGKMEEIGDTDSVNSLDEAKDLGEAIEEAF